MRLTAARSDLHIIHPSEDLAQVAAGGDTDGRFEISSTEAYVAATQALCWCCDANMEVICSYCATGIDLDQELTHFTISNIWSMDEALARQLAHWPNFKKGIGPVHGAPYFANHCPHCGALQEDSLLHDVPGDLFFPNPQSPPSACRLTPLAGPIRVSGACHFAG